MLEIIEHCMSCNHPALDYKENAEDILNSIEAHGMLPPATMIYVDQENGNTLCTEACEWDDENE